ncbi:MAG: type VII toxin-antitoxin system HepT family RNase toxin [Dethiobacteria bacterium]
MIDTTKVLSKLRVIKENLVKLNKLKEVPEEIFIKDFEKHDSAKYSLQTSIEAMIDICNHIISRKCLGMPKTKADAFIILCQNNILSPDMQSTYTAMARFRNRVVHLYEQVDTVDVYKYVTEGISDFNQFIYDIDKFLSQEQ